MNIDVGHVPLEKEEVLEWCHPLIVPDPLRSFPNLTSDAQVPVVDMLPQVYVLNRIPEVFPEGGITEKAPVLVRRQ
jgi:hypothetical protein